MGGETYRKGGPWQLQEGQASPIEQPGLLTRELAPQPTHPSCPCPAPWTPSGAMTSAGRHLGSAIVQQLEGAQSSGSPRSPLPIPETLPARTHYRGDRPVLGFCHEYWNLLSPLVCTFQ